MAASRVSRRRTVRVIRHAAVTMEARWTRPSKQRGLVLRSALFDRLSAGGPGGVTLVSAPAGEWQDGPAAVVGR